MIDAIAEGIRNNGGLGFHTASTAGGVISLSYAQTTVDLTPRQMCDLADRIEREFPADADRLRKIASDIPR
tara:strand:- start:4254 stop:4466 length:213 start_codon:yes stop_codon:yes gene_type:complete